MHPPQRRPPAGPPPPAPHLKKPWDRRVRSAGRRCGAGCSRAECRVCRKLQRASAETEIQSDS